MISLWDSAQALHVFQAAAHVGMIQQGPSEFAVRSGVLPNKTSVVEHWFESHTTESHQGGRHEVAALFSRVDVWWTCHVNVAQHSAHIFSQASVSQLHQKSMLVRHSLATVDTEISLMSSTHLEVHPEVLTRRSLKHLTKMSG